VELAPQSNIVLETAVRPRPAEARYGRCGGALRELDEDAGQLLEFNDVGV